MSFVSEVGHVALNGGGDNSVQSNVALNNNVVDNNFNYGRKELAIESGDSDVDQNKQENSNGVPDGSPRNQSLSCPNPPGTALPTPNSSQQGGAPEQSQNPSPGLIVNANTSSMKPVSMSLQSTPPATDNIFSNEFIQSVANGLDEFVDVELFRGDGGLNFERSFGQWFAPNASSVNSVSMSLQSMPPATDNIFSDEFIQSVANGLDEFVDVGLFRGDGDLDFERDFGQWFVPDDEMEPDGEPGFWQWFKDSHEYED
ncbi:hypothetical protein DFH06DRAFT_1481191 [Mycena polygramma]|nr:hypothetical protein DFH06DRAFT_1481191 [Mycena polygramma]